MNSSSSRLSKIFGKSMNSSMALARRSIEKSERPKTGCARRLGEKIRGSERNSRQASSSAATPPEA